MFFIKFLPSFTLIAILGLFSDVRDFLKYKYSLNSAEALGFPTLGLLMDFKIVDDFQLTVRP
jgi:hypothetical protein